MSNLQDLLLLVSSFLIILGGVTYWLYSHIEQQQRKIGVLENVLYELRFAMKQGRAVSEEEGYESVEETKDNGVDKSDKGDKGSGKEDEEEEDDEDEEDDRDNRIKGEKRDVIRKDTVEYAAPPESVTDEVDHTLEDWNGAPTDLDLRPGASMEMNEEEILQGWSAQSQKKIGESDNSQFKNLFVSPSTDTVTALSGSPLESMSLKDLRQVASSRKIIGAKSMKRNDLLEALRASSSLSPIRSLDE